MSTDNIGSSRPNSEGISDQLQQVILNSIRKILPDRMIEQTRKEVGYRFRRRKITPVVAVLHMVMAAMEVIARLAALNVVRSIILEAAAAAKMEDPLRISFVHTVRAIISFSAALSRVPLALVPEVYHAMLLEIAWHVNPERPGRLEPRAVCREHKHYPSLKMTRTQWRAKHAA
jgi:hypothetical protein